MELVMGREEKQLGEILKVTIEYEGVTYVAEGEDAEQWLGWINFCEYLTKAHGHQQGFKWTRIEKLKKK